jgi:hypothetical protein
LKCRLAKTKINGSLQASTFGLPDICRLWDLIITKLHKKSLPVWEGKKVKF